MANFLIWGITSGSGFIFFITALILMIGFVYPSNQFDLGGYDKPATTFFIYILSCFIMFFWHIVIIMIVMLLIATLIDALINENKINNK